MITNIRRSISRTCMLALLMGVAVAQAPINFEGSNSSEIVNVVQNGSGFGIEASTTSTGGVGAVFGQATGTSGYNNGVWGRSFSPAGVAVRGENKATTGTATGGAFFSSGANGLGLYAAATSQTGAGVGAHGFAQSPNGVGLLGDVASPCLPPTGACGAGFPIGVLAKVNATSGAAGVFEQDYSDGGGQLIIGRTMSHTSGVLDNVFRVQDSGDVFAASYNTGGADFAESFSVRGAKALYGAGDVLVIDQTSSRRLTRSTKSYSTLVAGIYSTQPGVLASPYKMGQTPASDVPLAVVGVVPCKVTTENGDIRAGDLLVTSHQAGYAMKGTDRHRMAGAIVGKALEPLTRETGVIQVLVTLQ